MSWGEGPARERCAVPLTGHGTACPQRTACLRDFPAVKRTTRRFGILIAAPVCGLRAVRAFRWLVLKVPNPTNVIESPFFSDLVMPSINDSTAAAAPDLDDPVSLAIFAISSCLFMKVPPEVSTWMRRLYASTPEVSTTKRPSYRRSVRALCRASDRPPADRRRTRRRVDRSAG